MIVLVKFVVFCILLSDGLNSASSTPTITECAAKGGECDESKGRPVCGSDGKTYLSRCHLIRAQCGGRKVSLKSRGACKESACQASRKYALAKKSRYVPKCKQDGNYAPVQCSENYGCWCVQYQGKTISDTLTNHGRPNCTGKGNQKRSPPLLNSNAPRKCSPNDRVLFNTNLVKVFHTEYSRSRSPTAISDIQVIEWKYKLLDANKNSILEKNEYRELKKIAKSIIKPKRCGRRFGKYCDYDKDGMMSREEFQTCLSKDLQKRLRDDKTTLELRNESEGNVRENDGESDCLSDRAAALDEQRYVPECTADGRFQRVQCYRSTGYCWCVHEDTGKNIPGTSTKDKRPQCDSIVSTRPMKGCPEPQKTEFLRDLKDFLKIQITSSTNIGADNTKWGTEDERIATLSFVLLDKNKNKNWERKEWKAFRDLVNTKQLRRCGKRMPRFCDVNNDKKITLSEWLNCLQAQRIQNEQTKPPLLSEPKPTSLSSTNQRRGPNPLESYLKSD
ncbi:unnamed protein product [Diamesa tonsa]